MNLTSNKFALFGMISASISIVLSLIMGSIGVLFAIIAILFGLKGLVDYFKNRQLGGLWGSASAIIIGFIFAILFGAGFVDLASDVPAKVLTGCGPGDEPGNELCYERLAVEKNDPSICANLPETHGWSCVSKYAIERNDLEVCRSLIDADFEDYEARCLQGIAAKRGDITLCNEIEERFAGKVYNVGMGDVEDCISSVESK